MRVEETPCHRMPFTVRWMIRLDLPRVLDIDWLSHELSWCSQDYLEHLRKSNGVGVVAERDGEILGVLLYELHPEHIDLLRLAVHPDHLRRGAGRALLENVATKLQGYEQAEDNPWFVTPRRRRFVRVDAENLEICAFLKAQGWAGQYDRASGKVHFTYRHRRHAAAE